MDVLARARQLALAGIEVRATQADAGGGGGKTAHEPAGSPKGGQFTHRPGSGGSKGTHRRPKKAAAPQNVPQAPATPRLVKEGDSGEDVRYAQYAMSLLGFNVAQDGRFGPETAAAVKQMQQRLGMKHPNGHITPTLLHKMQDAVRLSPCVGGQRDLAFEALWEQRDDDDLDETAEAVLDAIDEFERSTGAEWDERAAHDVSKELRIPGGKGGGRWTKNPVTSAIAHALEEWAKGNGPDDPFVFDGKPIDREPLRKAAVARGISLKRGASREDIVAALKDDLKVKVADAKAAKSPDVGKPVRFTLKGHEPAGTVRAEGYSSAAVEQLRVVADGKGGYLGQRQDRATDEWHDFPALGTGNTPKDVTDRFPRGQWRSVRAPGGANKLRNLDVGVFHENGKLALWEVSDSGERRKRVALVDDLAGLESWANEHGEPELAGWAHKERGGAEAPKKAPAKALTGDAALAAAPIDFTKEYPDSGLTLDEETVFADYVGDGAYAINPALREYRGHTSPHDDDTAHQVRLIDAAMSRSPLTADVLVERGISHGADPEMFGEKRWRGDLTGATLLDYGYQSTTTRPGGGVQYAEQEGLPFEQATLHVRVPAGTQAIKMSGAEYEDELLLQRGLTIRVTSDTGYTENGGRRIEAEVVDGPPAAPAMLSGAEFDQLTSAQQRKRMRDAGFNKSTIDMVVAESSQAKSKTSKATPAKKATKAAPTAAPDVNALRTLDTEARRDALDLRKVDELKALLREQGLPVSGKKRDLVDRLVGHLEGDGKPPAKISAAKKTAAPKAPTPRVGGLPRSTGTPSVEADALATNPSFGTTVDGAVYRAEGKAGGRWTPDLGPLPSGAYEENCTNAVAAFEMRMRGYDVEAAPLDVLDKQGYAGGRTFDELDALLADSWTLPDGTPHGRSFAGQSWRSFDEIDKEVGKWPEGGRGYIFVGKHIFSVVKTDGKVRYIEPQYDATDDRDVTRLYREKFGGSKQDAKVVRIDDLEPTDAVLHSVRAR